eukprot:scaffold42982_cov205-Skeletonema_dohrnii-CCMP3373.AAC.1
MSPASDLPHDAHTIMPLSLLFASALNTQLSMQCSQASNIEAGCEDARVKCCFSFGRLPASRLKTTKCRSCIHTAACADGEKYTKHTLAFLYEARPGDRLSCLLRVASSKNLSGSPKPNFRNFFGSAAFACMSSSTNTADEMTTSESVMLLCCASCGIGEVDDVELKECANCDLARYCSDTCQENHKSQHNEACKNRAAELRDELLFKQPDSSHLGDCPICCLPLPVDLSKSTLKLCCSKIICNGCNYANMKRELEEGRRESNCPCPFCRKPIPDTDEESDKRTMKRIEANDPVAMTQWGRDQYDKGDYSVAFEYYTRAAELRYVEAHHQLSVLYHHGRGVEKDEKKELYHMEEAAIGGHPDARYNLACYEGRKRRHDRAVKHFSIAAAQGFDESIKLLLTMFTDGRLVNYSKDILAAALRAYQAAVDATKSPQREAAEELQRRIKSGER